MRLHIVGAFWGDDGPVILAADPHDRGGVQRVDTGGRFDWTLGASRVCVGQFMDGQHVPCPDAALVTQWHQCPRCSQLETPECVFEPRCRLDPSTCTCPFGPIPHVVYAAFHGTLAKVGMTQVRRVERRLREQGADAWFIVHEYPDRASARDAERTLSRLYHVPEYRRHTEVLPQLARPVDWDRIVQRAEELRGRLAPRYEAQGELHRLTGYPLPQPLPGIPRRRYSVGRHAGTWLGAKGPHLIYLARAGPDTLALGIGEPLVALKMTDLPGRTLELAEPS